MFENPRRGRQARNFTTNAPKILDLRSSSEQIFSRKLPLGAPALHLERKSQSNARVYIRKRADNTRVKKELQEFATDFEVMKNESVDAKWNMFQQRLTGIMTIMDCCMPHKFITSRHNLPWFNRSLR